MQYALIHTNKVYIFDKDNLIKKESIDKVNEIKEKAVLINEEFNKEKYIIFCDIIRKQEKDLYKEIYDYALLVIKNKLKKINIIEDLIIQAINAINDLDKAINLLSTRLRRFILPVFPELSLLIDDNDKIVEICSKHNYNEVIDYIKNNLCFFTLGCEIGKDDYKIIKEYSKKIKRLYEEREKLSDYIKENMNRILPNFTKISGPLIGAKLLAQAGSIENLVKMPASTIQLLGAEKALFRHLKSGSRCPKYGILYQHPLVQKANNKIKGKVARMIADKLALAIKVDYYNPNKNVGDKYLKEIKDKIKKLTK